MRAESMIVPCGYCDGEGRVYRGHPNDPEPRSARCPVCGGKGLEEVACEPGGRDDDLDEREAARSEPFAAYVILAGIALGTCVVSALWAAGVPALVSGGAALGFLALIVHDLRSA